MLDKVGLRPEAFDRYPHMFSGGQRQRIAIARALMLRPAVVTADEPVSALDMSVQAQILNLLRDLQDELGTAYLFISHDIAVVRHMARDVLVMYCGRPAEQGSRAAVLDRPLHPYTRMLLASTPFVDPARRRTMTAGGRPAAVAARSAAGLRLRQPLPVHGRTLRRGAAGAAGGRGAAGRVPFRRAGGGNAGVSHSTPRTELPAGLPAIGEQPAEVDDGREDLLVQVRALPVVGRLLQLHDLAVLLEDPLGEQDQQRPGGLDQQRDTRPADREQAEGAVAALLLVDRHVGNPQMHDRQLVARPDPQGLVRILGADGHLVAIVGPAAAALAAEDHPLAERHAAAGAGEGVVDLEPVLAHAAAEVARPDLPHLRPVQELMVHVHQVLVHERVVTADRLAEAPGLVAGIGDGPETRERHLRRRGGRHRGRRTRPPPPRDSDKAARRSGACICRDRAPRCTCPSLHRSSRGIRSGCRRPRPGRPRAALADARSDPRARTPPLLDRGTGRSAHPQSRRPGAWRA